jgi:hypothetical protein
MNAVKIFLSIRHAESASGEKGFTVKSGKKRISEKNLYYKFLKEKEGNKKVSEMSRMLKSDIEVFIYKLKQTLESIEKKDILFFIHGYHPGKNSLHMDLFDNMFEKYGKAGVNNNVGAIIFFSWPNRGLMWKEDDEAAKIGKILANDYKYLFESIHELTDKNSSKFFLLCQSFGHHILNAFSNNLQTNKILFEKIFLTAADIPNQSFNEHPTGIIIQNKIGYGGPFTHYDLTSLFDMTNKVHVFHDPCDLVLTASQRNFLKNYDRLGKTGVSDNSNSKLKNHEYGEYSGDMYLGDHIKTNLPNFKILKRKYNKRHQYFFTNSKIVEIINDEFKKP